MSYWYGSLAPVPQKGRSLGWKGRTLGQKGGAGGQPPQPALLCCLANATRGSGRWPFCTPLSVARGWGAKGAATLKHVTLAVYRLVPVATSYRYAVLAHFHLCLYLSVEWNCNQACLEVLKLIDHLVLHFHPGGALLN